MQKALDMNEFLNFIRIKHENFYRFINEFNSEINNYFKGLNETEKKLRAYYFFKSDMERLVSSLLGRGGSVGEKTVDEKHSEAHKIFCKFELRVKNYLQIISLKDHKKVLEYLRFELDGIEESLESLYENIIKEFNDKSRMIGFNF
jgi:hypothetical protein